MKALGLTPDERYNGTVKVSLLDQMGSFGVSTNLDTRVARISMAKRAGEFRGADLPSSYLIRHEFAHAMMRFDEKNSTSVNELYDLIVRDNEKFFNKKIKSWRVPILKDDEFVEHFKRLDYQGKGIGDMGTPLDMVKHLNDEVIKCVEHAGIQGADRYFSEKTVIVLEHFAVHLGYLDSSTLLELYPLTFGYLQRYQNY